MVKHKEDRRGEKRFHAASLWASVLACSLAFAGCSKSPYESTVSGTVTLDGASIGEAGTIQFVPVDRSHNPATGPIEVDGSYQVLTGNQKGLRPGEYDVTLAIYAHVERPPGERAPIGSSPLLTPEKYLSLESTDLRFTVRPGKNTIDIPLVNDESNGP